MNRESPLAVKLLHAVHSIARHIHHPAPYLGTNGHRNRGSCIEHLHTPLQAVGTVHRDRTHRIFSNMLLDLHRELPSVLSFYQKGVMDTRQVPCHILTRKVEPDIDHRTYYL